MKSTISITKDEFYTYEFIRSSGLTNMFDVGAVIKWSTVMDGPVLTREIIVEIMKNYDKLMDLYPSPSDGVIGIRAKQLREKDDNK